MSFNLSLAIVPNTTPEEIAPVGVLTDESVGFDSIEPGSVGVAQFGSDLLLVDPELFTIIDFLQARTRYRGADAYLVVLSGVMDMYTLQKFGVKPRLRVMQDGALVNNDGDPVPIEREVDAAGDEFEEDRHILLVEKLIGRSWAEITTAMYRVLTLPHRPAEAHQPAAPVANSHAGSAPAYTEGANYGAAAGPRPLSESGTTPHALAFLGWLPIPIFSVIIAGVVMWLSYLVVRRRGPKAEAIARSAANWGITLILLTILWVVLFVLSAVSNSAGGLPPAQGLLIFGLFGIGIAHLVSSIVGTVKASNGVVWVNPIAIPFYRRGPAPSRRERDAAMLEAEAAQLDAELGDV